MAELNEMNSAEPTINVESINAIATENEIIEASIAEEIIVENKPLETSADDNSTIQLNANEIELVDLKPSEIVENISEEIELEEGEIANEIIAEDQIDYSHFNNEDLLKLCETFSKEKSPAIALQSIKNIKNYFDATLHEEQEQALHKHIEEGGEKDDFEYKKGIKSKDRFNSILKELKEKQSTQRAIAEAERFKNLKAKEAILDEIKKLNESEENKDSLKKIKELQLEWKKIKNVPKEHMENLWESYRVLNEIFYDRLSINNELKELDRERNLDQKIELCKRSSELHEEKSIKVSLITVKKLQEEWRNIGPVPKEASDEIWARFKAEIDKVYTFIKTESEKNELIRKENLELKKNLIAKAIELSKNPSNKVKNWFESTKVANDLMEQWKKIGYVPLANRDKIWEEFRKARSEFFNTKNIWFKEFNGIRNENLKKKSELCEKAEKFSLQPIEWLKITNEIKSLQDQWKQIGPVPDRNNDAVWKRFRTACDSFFEKKSGHFASQVEEQKTNLLSKKELISKLEIISNQEEENKNVFIELKAIQDSWNSIGFVPMKQKDEILKTYNEWLDKIYNRYRDLKLNMREANEKANFDAMISMPNGQERLQREERVLLERIKGLKSDMSTWDNNLGFFKNAATKSPLAMQFEDKIAIGQKHVDQLEEKLKTIRSYKKQASEAV